MPEVDDGLVWGLGGVGGGNERPAPRSLSTGGPAGRGGDNRPAAAFSRGIGEGGSLLAPDPLRRSLLIRSSLSLAASAATVRRVGVGARGK